ncbi:MAG: DNA repair protein RadA [Leptospirales bacterium]
MAKKKDSPVFECPVCGYRSSKWMGFCPSCQDAPEGLVSVVSPGSRLESILGEKETGLSRSLRMEEIGESLLPRIPSGFGEFDRVLGGGFVPGSFVLLGGDPGVGKSTLILQSVSRIARTKKVLYAAGEESPEQIRMRYDRLQQSGGDLHILPETDLEAIVREVALLKPDLLVVDSIQTVSMGSMGLATGSVGQLREAAALLMELAKRAGVTVLVIGHVTKEGVIAGPRVLEHLVDTVLYLEGDRSHPVRLLRTVKNRFGPTRELGIFEMDSAGLREVENASAFFLEGRKARLPGSVVVSSLEGSRPLLVELQALVSPTSFPNPRRVAQGVGGSRLTILAAVLERRFGLALSGADIYVNVVGGVALEETALDLGLAMALAGSLWDTPLPPDWVVFGEVGLGGEVRRVPETEERLKEAARHGFRHGVIPLISSSGEAGKGSFEIPGMSLHPVRELNEALGLFQRFREERK